MLKVTYRHGVCVKVSFRFGYVEIIKLFLGMHVNLGTDRKHEKTCRLTTKCVYVSNDRFVQNAKIEVMSPTKKTHFRSNFDERIRTH
jgi:hypothetical protein